jgi:MFS family permease
MVTVLFLTALFSYTDRLILSVLVDQLRADLRLSDSEVGLLQGPAFTLVYVFASLFFGRLADRQARKPLLIAGASLWCGATILCGLAPNALTLLVGRLLLGAAEAALIPTAVSMIADVFPAERRGAALGLFVLGTVVGGPLGITAGGVLLSAAKSGAFAGLPLVGQLMPWRAVLVTVGCAGFVAPLLLLSVREPARLEAAVDSGATGARSYFVSNARRLLPLYGAMALLSIGDYGLVSWVPTTLARRFEWQPDQIGLAFGIITAAAGVAGSLSGGWLSDLAEKRGGVRGRLAVSIVAAAVAALAAAAISGGRPEWVLSGLGAWIFASTVGAIGALAVIQELVPNEYRGTGVALLTFSNTLVGLGCGPTLVALTTDHVYAVPAAVDFSISTVAVPAGVLACALLGLARLMALEAEWRPRVRVRGARSGSD